MLRWRQMVLHQLETGHPPPEEMFQNFPRLGLLCDDGISGEDAKKRFEELSIYFFACFYNPEPCPHRQHNMIRLQSLVDELMATTSDCNSVNKTIENCEPSITNDQLGDLQEDILHRVFHYLHA